MLLIVTCFRPKGDNVDVKGITESTVGVQQCFVVFDVLKINDENLANCPLVERTEQLKKYVRACSYVQCVEKKHDSGIILLMY